MLDYKITEKAPFTIVGMKKRFRVEDSYEKIPQFWQEWQKDPKGILGVFGVCVDMNGEDFDYWIADNYIPYSPVSTALRSMSLPHPILRTPCPTSGFPWKNVDSICLLQLMTE